MHEHATVERECVTASPLDSVDALFIASSYRPFIVLHRFGYGLIIIQIRTGKPNHSLGWLLFCVIAGLLCDFRVECLSALEYSEEGD